MSIQEDKIDQYLKSLGFTVQFTPHPSVPTVRTTFVNHVGLPITIYVDRNTLIWAEILFGYMPKVNIAPFLRRLVSLQLIMGGAYFGVYDSNALILRITRQIEGLDLVEFKWILDTLSAQYWQNVQGLVQEFQIPQQPS